MAGRWLLVPLGLLFMEREVGCALPIDALLCLELDLVLLHLERDLEPPPVAFGPKRLLNR